MRNGFIKIHVGDEPYILAVDLIEGISRVTEKDEEYAAGCRSAIFIYSDNSYYVSRETVEEIWEMLK